MKSNFLIRNFGPLQDQLILDMEKMKSWNCAKSYINETGLSGFHISERALSMDFKSSTTVDSTAEY